MLSVVGGNTQTVPMDQELDLGDFRMKRQVEAQSLRALNAQLETEVSPLP